MESKSDVFNPEEQPLDELAAQAAAAVAGGENTEQVLEALQLLLPAESRDRARKKFIAALAKRGLRPPSNELADIPSRRTLSRIRAALTISTQQLVDRMMSMVRARPDIATQIKQAGQILARNGVAVDRVALSEADLGTITPVSTGVASDRERGTTTGRS